MAALLNSFIDNQDKAKIYLLAAKQKGITILPPSVNESNEVFTPFPNDNSIRFGLGGIKYVGSGAQSIINERKERGAFNSLSDFLSRMTTYQNINKRMIESLILSGALDEFPGSRQSKIEAVPAMLKFIKKIKETLKKSSLYETLDLFRDNILTFTFDESIPEMPQDSFLENEKDRLGFYASAHPLDKYNDIFKQNGIATVASLKGDEEADDDEIAPTYTQGRKEVADVIGIVKDLKKSFAKSSGKPYWSFILEDQTGDIKCVGFSDSGDETAELLKDGAILFLHCRVKRDDFGVSLTAYSFSLAEDYIAYTQAKKIFVVPDSENAEDRILNILSKVGRGKTKVYIQDSESGKTKLLLQRIKLSFSQYIALQKEFGKKRVVSEA